MTEPKCMYCKDSGWLWRHELPDTSDWDGSSDDTRYLCTYCGCEIAESSRCKADRLKKEAELVEKNRVELLDNDLAVMLRDGIDWVNSVGPDYLCVRTDTEARLYSTILAVQSRHKDILNDK